MCFSSGNWTADVVVGQYQLLAGGGEGAASH